MKENKDEVVKLSIENFIPWLEKRFNDKYESSLESLKERFVGIFTVFKIILEKTVEIDQILSEDGNDANVYSQYKPLLDNMIRLLDMMMKEFPECLDLEFVEFFFLSVQERIQIYLAHFHQFFHIHFQDPIVNNKISNFFYYIGKCTKIIDSAISLIPQSVIELQKRAELSVPLLKYIKDCKFMFRTPIKKLKEEIQVLSNDKSYEDFETVIEDVKNRSKGTMKFKMDFVNKMIDLVKEATQYQFEINKMLKPYFSMANAIKTKGKKFLNENLKSTDQAKILKFVTLLLRPDFTNNVLPSLEISELAYIIKLLESQVSLVGEYRKSLVKGVEEFQLLNPVDFEVTLEKYKLVMTEMNSFQEFVQKNFEVTKFNKDTINQVIKDIKRVVDKYKEFQNGIYHYQEILELFNKVRNLTGKFCFSEFNLKVELICEYNL
jgi:hypothetical protein